MIENVFNNLKALLKLIKNLSREQRELRDNALRSISYALNETYIYYQSIERGHHRNTDTEEQLSKYWAAAAIPMRHIDKDLAMTCDLKSEYWINPENWDNDRIIEVGIELNDIRKRYRELVRPHFSRTFKTSAQKIEKVKRKGNI